MQIVTFDFHNTVAHCDPWFELEIRTLPAAVLARMTGVPDVPDIEHRYRTLRREVIDSGRECDAVTSVSKIFCDAGIAHDPAGIAGHIDDLMRGCLAHLSPVPGAVETISTLTARGIPVGIVSSAVHHDFLEWALTAFGVRDRLAFVATSASIGYYKSVTEIYRLAYNLVDANPALGVHVGDSPRWDIDTAQRAGLAAVLYAPCHNGNPHDPEYQPDLVLDSLVDAAGAIVSLLDQRRARPVV